MRLPRPLRGIVTGTAFAVILGLPALTGDLHAQEPDSTAAAAVKRRVLVFRAKLIGRLDPTADQEVNLLVEDGRLVLITKDPLVVRPGDVALDAEGGFLLGQLALGREPTFVILDEDPRENFEALLNTQRHVRFAMELGVTVRNDLPTVAEEMTAESARSRTWSSYVPPPMAVPLRYYDARKWNRFTTRPVSGLLTGALVLDRLSWTTQDDDSESQVGDLDASEGGEIRAFRMGVIGTLNFPRPWSYTVFLVTHAFDQGFDSRAQDDWRFFDYRLDIPLADQLTLSVGKQKEPISHERLVTISSIAMQERAAVSDALLPSRNHGVVLSGAMPSRRITWSAGAFNDWIDTDLPFSETSVEFAGRATWVPAVSADGSHMLHLGVGLRTSDAKETLRFRARPEFNAAPPFVDTDEFSAERVNTLNLESYWRYGPYFLGAEYLGSAHNAPAFGDPYLHGYHVSFSWAVTGEMRGYRARTGTFDGLVVARPVNQGGWGTFDLKTRLSRIDLTDGSLQGGEMDVWSFGGDWWPTQWAHVSMNYRLVWLDRDDMKGLSSGFNMRLMLMLM
jgi:phosphate-selective porin OprO/OprP